MADPVRPNDEAPRGETSSHADPINSDAEPAEEPPTYEAEDIVTAKVVNIKPYGAFVQLPDEAIGLVHISEIDEAYVHDVHDHLAIGQEIAVKVIGRHESGKYNLSIRRLSRRERESAFYSRQVREFSRELEMRREELQRETSWRQAVQQKRDEPAHASESASLADWVERARALHEELSERSEERARSYPLL